MSSKRYKLNWKGKLLVAFLSLLAIYGISELATNAYESEVISQLEKDKEYSDNIRECGDAYGCE